MKRYIRYIKASDTSAIDTSMFEGTPIIPHTGFSYYDDFLDEKELAYKQKAKNRTGKIVLMSPDEYYEDCSSNGFDHTVPVSKLKFQRRANSETIDWLSSQLDQGKKFNLPYINYVDHAQEGLHRMMVLGDRYGWNTKFPVLVVYAYDQKIEDEWRKIEALYEFIQYKFKYICQDAANDIVSEYPRYPENFTELLHDKIIEVSKTYYPDEPYDIDVDISTDVLDGEHRILVYVSRYFDYVPEVQSNPVELWVENLYDLEDEDISDEEINEGLPDDPEEDIDISDLFFKP